MALKVERENLAPCLTCPLCNKLFRKPTTITECLHTFCRKCIYRKIKEEDVDYCPVCNINLGGSPLDKLRQDHNLENLRVKIFALKKKKNQPLDPKKAKMENGKLIQRRRRKWKVLARMHPDLRHSFYTENPLNNVENDNQTPQAERKDSSLYIPEHQKKNKDFEGSAESLDPKVDLLQPLNQLVQISNRSKVKKYNREIRAQIMQHPEINRFDGRFSPIWISLTANQDVESPLPQIPSRYIRIKDGKAQVSTIKKYVAQKLGLANEDEVEITIRSHPVGSMVPMQELAEWCLQPFSESVFRVGSSGKDFVIPLSYARK